MAAAQGGRHRPLPRGRDAGRSSPGQVADGGGAGGDDRVDERGRVLVGRGTLGHHDVHDAVGEQVDGR